MTWYKFLARGGVGVFSGRPWPSPDGSGQPGGWIAAARLEPCRSGLHLCRPQDLPFWLCEELYTVEVHGEVVPQDSFVLAHRARLLARVDAWGQDLASSFCRECAERVRDLAVAALRADGRPADATRLASCETTEEIREATARILEGADGVSPLVGYAMDAAKFATLARTQPRWAAGTATTAFVSAKAAGVSADGSSARDRVVAERRRQGDWLTSHLLATL